MVAELSVSLTPPGKNPSAEIIDDRLQIDSDAGRQPDHGRVDLPVLVGALCSESFFGLCGVHPPSRTFPPAPADHLVPRACRGEELAKPLHVKR